MSLKTGDKVKMTKEGFKYYSNLYNAFNACDTSKRDSFEECVCTLFSIHGTGTIKEENTFGDYRIRWEFKINGQYYYSTMWYGKESIRKLSFKEKILSLLGAEK